MSSGRTRGSVEVPGHGLTGTGRRRRGLVVVLIGALVSSSFVLVAAGLEQDEAEAACGRGAYLLDTLPGPAVCVHEDQPPPGVDVTEYVSTAELKERDGAGPAAYEAAENLGVPTADETVATSPSVPCDGNGTSGYRVQGMYVVEAGAPNRFAALRSSFKLWAAGVDDVYNRSAALSGGVRNVRYVTEAGPGGTCEAQILNVTVPVGALNDFNSTVNAVVAQGYDDPTRKYMMWADATRLCGVGSRYVDDSGAQSNLNNGGNPLYARTDSGCWGFGDGSRHGSVEAHELMHNLGGVQRTAPHATTAGHCWDESDSMCYRDASGRAMVQTCSVDQEYLLDCNSDDYYSTFADPGSYLETRWNTGNSRFLIGGGNGAGGGTAGAPTVLGAAIGVNNPAVPGLATQVSVTPSVPAGRTVTSVQWTAARPDCSFSDPTEVQSTVTCAATSVAPTSVTVRLVDSSGATKTRTSPLTFATNTARPVSVSLGVAGQDGATASVCTGAGFPVAATVTDAASGLPVKGLSASFTKQAASMTHGCGRGQGDDRAHRRRHAQRHRHRLDALHRHRPGRIGVRCGDLDRGRGRSGQVLGGPRR